MKGSCIMEILFFAKKLWVAQNTFHVPDTLFKTLNGKIAWLALSKNQDPENQTLCSLTRLGQTEPCNYLFVLFLQLIRIHDHSISLVGLQ